ncbi:hypothetical protein SAMN05421831_11319 [Allopseudospirillum japonicum]|uniref:Uncharacterized protein n=1 Tax=Allopseudospirillum japonicum TaxID=64971 RepID=A0A1H6TYV5_9GAMM|nr:hypothetical protein [Allopseudospirillum japonicum]SEI85298.1 hypothetical protein SAMN05421831_11319 [Allopseudospirillum japonicum]
MHNEIGPLFMSLLVIAAILAMSVYAYKFFKAELKKSDEQQKTQAQNDQQQK